jgi:hypothetical protein
MRAASSDEQGERTGDARTRRCCCALRVQLISPASGLVVRVGGYADRPKSEKGGGDGFEGFGGTMVVRYIPAVKGEETVGG